MYRRSHSIIYLLVVIYAYVSMYMCMYICMCGHSRRYLGMDFVHRFVIVGVDTLHRHIVAEIGRGYIHSYDFVLCPGLANNSSPSRIGMEPSGRAMFMVCGRSVFGSAECPGRIG